MIKYIVKYLLKAAKENKKLVGFTYGYPDKVLGNGEDFYPHLYVEEPLYIRTGKVESGTVGVTINLEVLTNDKRENKTQNQRIAEKIAYELIEYINSGENKVGLKVGSYSILSLSNYTDDSSFGVRVTLDCTAFNPINYCDVIEEFTEDGTLIDDNVLNKIDIKEPEACNTDFTFKLNDIKFDE